MPLAFRVVPGLHSGSAILTCKSGSTVDWKKSMTSIMAFVEVVPWAAVLVRTALGREGDEGVSRVAVPRYVWLDHRRSGKG